MTAQEEDLFAGAKLITCRQVLRLRSVIQGEGSTALGIAQETAERLRKELAAERAKVWRFGESAIIFPNVFASSRPIFSNQWRSV